MGQPSVHTSAKNLALQNSRARIGEVIKWNGQFWRCISKTGIYTSFERCAGGPRGAEK